MFKYQQRRKKETYFLNNFLDFKKLRLDLYCILFKYTCYYIIYIYVFLIQEFAF